MRCYLQDSLKSQIGRNDRSLAYGQAMRSYSVCYPTKSCHMNGDPWNRNCQPSLSTCNAIFPSLSRTALASDGSANLLIRPLRQDRSWSLLRPQGVTLRISRPGPSKNISVRDTSVSVGMVMNSWTIRRKKISCLGSRCRSYDQLQHRA